MTPGRSIFISPHPDDAVWSCGGELIRVVQAGERPLVLTVFDGDAPVEWTESWRRIATPAIRRRENTRALSEIGAEGRSIGLTDAALRKRSDGAFVYAAPESLVACVSRRERELIEALSADLAGFCRRGGDIVYVPQAGASSHVDHKIVRAAAERLQLATLRHYPDFPYARSDGIHPAQLKSIDLDTWIRVANLYRSQVLALFGSRARFSAALRSWAETGGAPPQLRPTHFGLPARAAR